jgi:isoquinoline 1-oxidoreductase beta subunit
MAAGWAQGVGVQEDLGSCTACLVEIDATKPTAPRVTKAVIAVDVGLPVNPHGVEAQIMGAAMDGIATVLQAGLHVEGGAVREASFQDHRWTRQKHAPVVWEIHVIPANGEPGGVGELGVPSAGGAVANAYARATGTRPRSFPIIA